MVHRIVQLGLPAPMTLVPHLLRAVDDWHARECQIEGCRVFLVDAGVVTHGVVQPVSPATPPPPQPARIVT